MNNSLFGRGKEKIIECFYKNRSKEMYFSEILRETKLTQNTTLRHLKNLEANNLVCSTRKIGNTFYSINPKNPEIYPLFAYFDYKRFNKLPQERKRAVNEFLNNIQIKPITAILFGSTAKGTFRKESDIDLLLVFNRKEAKEAKAINDIEAVTGFRIQAFIIDHDYFKEQLLREDDKVITHAIKTGFPIRGFEIFYKEVLNA